MAAETAEERVARLKEELATTQAELKKSMKGREKSRAVIERERAEIAKRKDEIERLRKREDKLDERLTLALERLEPAFASAMLDGHQAVSKQLTTVIAHGVGKFDLIVTSTGDGVHSETSFHFTKPPQAVDLAAPMTTAGIERMKKFQRFAAKKWSSSLRELFGPDDFHFKNGARIAGAFPDHQDHVHIAR
jgi:hypothetical protein